MKKGEIKTRLIEYIIILVAVGFVILFIVTTPAFSDLLDPILNKDIISEEERRQTESAFDELINSLEQCRSSNDIECFCNARVLLTGYKLKIAKVSEGNTKFVLLDRLDRPLSPERTIENTKPCFIIERLEISILATSIGDKEFSLILDYGKDLKATYINNEFKFNSNPDNIFYKVKENEICVLKDKVAEFLKDFPLCGENQKT